MLIYGIAAVALAELASMGKIKYENKRIMLMDASLTGDELLDEALDICSGKASPCKVTMQISAISYKVKRFAKRVLERLEDNGFIKIEQKRFLGLIPYDTYMITRVSEHEKLVKELKDIVLRADQNAEPKNALVITILKACYVLHRLFDKEERRQASATLKAIGRAQFFMNLDDFGAELMKAVKSLIAAAQSAAG